MYFSCWFFVFTRFSYSCIACAGTLSSFLASRESLTSEESMVVDALLAMFESRMSSPDDLSALRVLMREVFPSSSRLRTSHSYRSGTHTAASDMLSDAIITQLHASGLQSAESLVSKVGMHHWCSLAHCTHQLPSACLIIMYTVVLQQQQ